ncbi:MAG: hypothetical protein DI603_19190 [Roseateles depolymerans]|uniref:Uncharacterized protein n=1 Tax=Roseateles depolymerans TaxID=76731 RepID=A0A2W5F7I1_9BURK|nr:MAG: hypothetical protein DI603_19190 [Roseateles depolymerans]
MTCPSRRQVLTLGLLAALALPASAEPLDDLIKAAEMDDGRTVSTLLNQGLNPNAQDARGRTALTVAAREQARAALQALLTSPKLDVDRPNGNNETALMLAAIRGSLPLAQLLVQRGASVNRPGWTPLHYAASGPDNGVATWLLAQGAQVDARSENGTTPLMMAARYGNSDLVPVLLKAGANAALKNEQGLGAADFARLGGRDRLVPELAARAATPDAK